MQNLYRPNNVPVRKAHVKKVRPPALLLNSRPRAKAERDGADKISTTSTQKLQAMQCMHAQP